MPRAKVQSIAPPRAQIPAGHGGLIPKPNRNDVLSGRGGRINNFPGNIMFRTMVEDYKHEYLDPRTKKLQKAHVAARLVAQIRGATPSGRFLREDQTNPGMYVEIGDNKAWKKSGQALREAGFSRRSTQQPTKTRSAERPAMIRIKQAVSGHASVPAKVVCAAKTTTPGVLKTAMTIPSPNIDATSLPLKLNRTVVSPEWTGERAPYHDLSYIGTLVRAFDGSIMLRL